MKILIITVQILLQLLINSNSILVIERGKLTRYDPDVMEMVYSNRIKNNQITVCDFCIGNIAVINCNYLNNYAFIHTYEYGLSGPYHITDCSKATDVKSNRKNNIIAELEYKLAKKWNMNNPLYNATVFIIEREYYNE